MKRKRLKTTALHDPIKYKSQTDRQTDRQVYFIQFRINISCTQNNNSKNNYNEENECV